EQVICRIALMIISGPVPRTWAEDRSEKGSRRFGITCYPGTVRIRHRSTDSWHKDSSSVSDFRQCRDNPRHFSGSGDCPVVAAGFRDARCPPPPLWPPVFGSHVPSSRLPLASGVVADTRVPRHATCL